MKRSDHYTAADALVWEARRAIKAGFHEEPLVAQQQMENVRLLVMAAEVHAMLATCDRGVEHEVRLTEEDAARSVERALQPTRPPVPSCRCRGSGPDELHVRGAANCMYPAEFKLDGELA